MQTVRVEESALCVMCWECQCVVSMCRVNVSCQCVVEEEVVEGDVDAKMGMDDIAQIGGLVADQGDIAYLWAWTIRLREEDWSLAW